MIKTLIRSVSYIHIMNAHNINIQIFSETADNIPKIVDHSVNESGL